LFDAPGTYAKDESGPLTKTTDVVGIPTVRVQVNAPLQQPISGLDPAGGLTLFFKLEDISPTGSATLPNRLISPVRLGDITGPVDVTLPGIVHRFAAGDRIALIIAGSDAAYRGDPLPTAVSISTSPSSPGVLTLPTAPVGSHTPLVFARSPAVKRGKRGKRHTPGKRAANRL
jgi:ABC-2 type transport system ATP-binding protein